MLSYWDAVHDVNKLHFSTIHLPSSHTQVNVTDVHAGELYMLADDPGQDRNVYSDADHRGIMKKMAHLPHVSSYSLENELPFISDFTICLLPVLFWFI